MFNTLGRLYKEEAKATEDTFHHAVIKMTDEPLSKYAQHMTNHDKVMKGGFVRWRAMKSDYWRHLKYRHHYTDDRNTLNAHPPLHFR